MKVDFIDIAEFRSFGYLQELNRQFLHPLGLALAVEVDEEGNETLGGIWDCRDDPIGLLYGEDMIDADKKERVAYDAAIRSAYRTEMLGFNIQDE